MKVPSGFAKAAQATADQIPREVISGLLMRLMPRTETVPVPASQAAVQPAPSGRVPVKAMTQPKRKARSGSRSFSTNRRYEVLHPAGYANHRRRTWRRAMVECILKCDNELSALQMLVENYPEYASKGIDLTWVAEQARYVRII
jgi:hypothetical protein